MIVCTLDDAVSFLEILQTILKVLFAHFKFTYYIIA